MRRFLVILASLLFISTLAFASGGGEKGAAAGGKQKSIVMVVKLEGVAWFDNMRTGITAFGKDYPDITASQTGGATADPAVQAKIIEDLTAKGVNAILAVPNYRHRSSRFSRGRTTQASSLSPMKRPFSSRSATMSKPSTTRPTAST